MRAMQEKPIICEMYKQDDRNKRVLAYCECPYSREAYTGVIFADVVCEKGDAECPIQKMLAEKAGEK